MITIDNIDFNKALKYLGYPRDCNGKAIALSDPATTKLLLDCSRQLLDVITPKSIYKILKTSQFDNTYGLVVGNDIAQHLRFCEKVATIAVTIGDGVDALIRKLQVKDMAQAVVVDALASVIVEQFLAETIVSIVDNNPNLFATWGFSTGYGDYPIQLQDKILALVDAQRKIGLCIDGQFTLAPSKSITTIVGLSCDPIPRQRQSCECCERKNDCNFRKWDEHCN